MRNCLKSILTMLAAMLTCASMAGEGFAQGRNLSLIEEAAGSVTQIAANELRLRGGNWGFNPGVSVVGGLINWNRQLDVPIELQANVAYSFIADGDFDALDVDMDLIDNATGLVVASDRSIARVARFGYTPIVGGNYTLRIILFNSILRLPCVCSATILRNNGVQVNGADMKNSVKDFANSFFREQILALNNGQRLLLGSAANNRVGFYGGFVAPGKSLHIETQNLGFGVRRIVGSAIGTKLELLNGQANILAVHNANDLRPTVESRIQGGMHSIRLTNTNQARSVFGFVALGEIH